ncbi:ring-opening amidohydrolase [Streptomyces avicenniae]|uniref:ring-opening amidohydrolase n=1 Tax=Streptomyces avicenniae TaxID=500153 RepID=UPI00069C6247|nr:ring-opening amidohydrolase [Streptomyces avicenniae]
MTVRIDSFDTAGPGDTAGLTDRLGALDPGRVRRLALLVKTEGNADVNDFSRELAAWRAEEAVLAHGGASLLERSVFLHSTGAEGAMTPFGYLIADLTDDADGTDGAVGTDATEGGGTLALGVGRSRIVRGGEIGSQQHVALAEQAVTDAVADAGLTPDQVALAIVKTPLVGHDEPTRVTSAEAKAVGALGAALALGEVERSRVVSGAFGRDLTLFSRRSMVFSSSEAARVEVLVLGNRPGAGGDLRIASGLLDDVLDAPGIRRVLAAAGAGLTADGTVADPGRVAALLVKAGHRHDGTLRGARTTVLTSHIDPDKHIRTVMSGVAGSVLGTGRMFISANSVHQAHDGGGLCVAVVRAAGAAGTGETA